ncbi:PH domain-containing protein [Hamadaea sp. NPDC050747]|uniref:PH domain-containing protein n=1 Tax=Hamadaea sp. NPDC050747 TaxID=3155789 RepID=UPI0033C6E73D
MTANAVRWSALPLALLAFLLRLADEAGWYGPEPGSRVALGFLVPVCLPVVAFTLLVWWATRRAAVPARDGVFVIPASPAAAVFAIFGANLLGELVPTAPPGEEPGIVLDAFDWTFDAPMGALLLLFTCAVFLLRRPRLVLDAAGITVQHLFRRHTVRWDEIADVRRITRPPTIRLVLHGSAVFGLARESVDLAVGWLFVNPDVLQVVIGHYAAHPAERSAIGTAEEAARLRAYAADQAAWA